ncbi:hypothetical protein PTKIN_Ptkin08bG0037900 [Pterospermum kingtungense]
MPPLHRIDEAAAGVDDDDVGFSNRGCCFWMRCGSAFRSIWWQRIAADDTSSAAAWSTTNKSYKESRWTRAWKKVRETSELVAGPKWKTFIRRFNKNRAGNRERKFQYDPLSYARNFDEGPGRNSFDEDSMNRIFSFRYASLLVSSNPSMDFDKDGPPFLT